MLIRFGRLASLTGSRIVRIPFWNSVLLPRLWLALLLLLLLTLRLALGLVLMLVLMTVAPVNRQGVLIHHELDIFRSHPWEGNIHLIAILRLTDVHRGHQRR